MQSAHRHCRSMGTRFDLVLPGKSELEADHIFSRVSRELERLEYMLSLYRHESELSLLNRLAHPGPASCSPELYGILEDMKRWKQDTAGYFDAAMLSATEHILLHPEEEEIAAEFLKRQGMDAVILEEGQVRFLFPDMGIDSGGYGKGLAVKNIVEDILPDYCDSALLSFGESLVYGLGSHPLGDCWKLKPPAGKGEEPPVFELRDQALSTSGNSLNNEKKFAISGHILNPHSGRMSRQGGVLSVCSLSPVRAEVLSTALFSAGRADEEKILNNFPGLEFARYAKYGPQQ